jgi:hypothetical protein
MKPFLQSPRARIAGLSIVALLGACQGGDESSPPDEDVGEAEAALCIGVDVTRSIMVVDPTILALFPLQDVLSQMISTAGALATTPLGLYQQWFDGLNDPAHGTTAGPHCTGLINGFPVDCPRQEGMLSATDPFVGGADSYIPVALGNRFDLAPASGADCGEYRIVYAKQSGRTNGGDRNFLIFEARLPNPTPADGLTGCKPVADFWANLTGVPSAVDRGNQLRDFYFAGLPGFPPVIRWDHFAGSEIGSGQIRTNMFMRTRSYFGGPALNQPWELREFHTNRTCAGLCSLEILPSSVKVNPAPMLFDPGTSAAFKTDFVNNQVAPLAAATINGIAMDTPLAFDAGQSVAVVPEAYAAHATGAAFLASINAELASIGSPLTAANIIDRATTQSCAGCHELSSNRPLGGGLAWPASLGFVHVDENGALSPALTSTFLPARKIALESCICGVTC